MSTADESSNGRERTIIYVVAAIVVVVLVVIALVAYRGHKHTEAAEAKADELISAIEDAGYPAPSQDQIVGVLGDDGGAICTAPTEALTQAVLKQMLFNGAAGPGARPIIADNLVVKGQLLVIETYCPDELPAFQEFVDELTYDDTVNQ